MHTFLTISLVLTVLVALVLVYLYWVRPILKLTPAFADLYRQEEDFLAAVQEKFAGIKQKLATALITIAGFIVMVYDAILPVATGVDLTPITSKVPQTAWPLVVIGVALILNWFRKLSEKREG